MGQVMKILLYHNEKLEIEIMHRRPSSGVGRFVGSMKAPTILFVFKKFRCRGRFVGSMKWPLT